MQEIIKNENTTIIQTVEHTTTRKIGKTTFFVSSHFKEGKEGDIVSTFSRLLQYDADFPMKTNSPGIATQLSISEKSSPNTPRKTASPLTSLSMTMCTGQAFL